VVLCLDDGDMAADWYHIAFMAVVLYLCFCCRVNGWPKKSKGDSMSAI